VPFRRNRNGISLGVIDDIPRQPDRLVSPIEPYAANSPLGGSVGLPDQIVPPFRISRKSLSRICTTFSKTKFLAEPHVPVLWPRRTAPTPADLNSRTVVVEDATEAPSSEGIERARTDLEGKGARFAPSTEIREEAKFFTSTPRGESS